MDTQQFDDMLREIYPSVLLEKEEKILTAIKSAWQKHKDRKINSSRGNDNYQYDDFVRMLINMESPHRNHLVVATELLSQNLKWPPDYYRRYSLIVRNYMKQRILGSIEKLGVGKNENGWYVFNTKQEEAFKVEFNAVVDDVLSINKNLVPTYMISFRHELNMADSRSTVLKELIDEWGVEKELPSLKKDLYSEFKSSVENNKSILENHFFSMIVDPAIIPQVKTAYIQAILNNDSLDKEKKKGVLEQHVNVVLEETNRFTVNLQEFYRLIGKYDYGTLIESSEFSKMIKVWHGSFEKVLGEGRRGEWRLDNYSLDTQSNVNIYEKIIKLMRNYFSEEAVFTFFNTPKVNFRACSLAYMTFIKEGLEHVVLDALNGNIEEIKINRYEIRSLFLSTEDLERIEQFVKKITDPEKRNFAKILFYRFGTKTNVNGYEEKNLDLFTRSLKEMLENPIEDEKIKKKLLELLSETPLSSDKEIAQMLTTSNESFDESKLKTHAYQDIGISFRHYCIKFSRMLVDKGLEQLKEEVNKTLANIKEREDEVDVDKFILTISDSLAKNLFLDQNIVDNANAYYEAISHVLDSFDHAEKDGQFGFSHALCLLFLDNKADQLPVFLARYKKQHVFHWEKELSTVEAIQLFKTAYLQNPEKSENILKSLNDFLNSKANDYYDYLSEENSKNMFDFIKADADKKQVLESYKKFNQKNKR